MEYHGRLLRIHPRTTCGERVRGFLRLEKAIKAKAFDIARGFLPAGCTTYVGWHSTLRQAWDHVRQLLFHPLPEVRQSGEDILAALREKYPSSFVHVLNEEQEKYYSLCGGENYHFLRLTQDFDFESRLDLNLLQKNESHGRILRHRPRKCELPDWFDRYGQIQFRFFLDFGSWRDIQRQRSCTQLMPLLTTHFGFHAWYLDSLPESLRSEAIEVIESQRKLIENIGDPNISQYYICMGFRVACELTAGLPSAVYIAELRSGQTVHPTLRPIAQKMGRVLLDLIPNIALHCDMSPDEWSTRRGKQDIVKREAV